MKYKAKCTIEFMFNGESESARLGWCTFSKCFFFFSSLTVLMYLYQRYLLEKSFYWSLFAIFFIDSSAILEEGSLPFNVLYFIFFMINVFSWKGLALSLKNWNPTLLWFLSSHWYLNIVYTNLTYTISITMKISVGIGCSNRDHWGDLWIITRIRIADFFRFRCGCWCV